LKGTASERDHIKKGPPNRKQYENDKGLINSWRTCHKRGSTDAAKTQLEEVKTDSKPTREKKGQQGRRFLPGIEATVLGRDAPALRGVKGDHYPGHRVCYQCGETNCLAGVDGGNV